MTADRDYTRSQMADVKREPLQELKDLLDAQEQSVDLTRHYRDVLRSQASASAAVLNELASTPITASPVQRSYVDVLIAAPSRDWAEGIAAHLRSALGAGAEVLLGLPGEPLPDSVPPTGFTVRCEVRLASVSASEARDRVRRALSNIDDAEVDYSQPLDLFVVTPLA
jgi:hypothetical protein